MKASLESGRTFFTSENGGKLVEVILHTAFLFNNHVHFVDKYFSVSSETIAQTGVKRFRMVKLLAENSN